MSIEIHRTGSHMCIVDNGRYGYRRYGVPVSGSMDLRSAARANSLLHNSMDCAVLEMYLSGHQMIFHAATNIALSGAQAEIHLNDQRIYTDKIIKISKGDTLSIGSISRGCRIYMSISGGIKSTNLLHSQSPLAGYFSRTLYKGDKISINKISDSKKTATISAIKLDLKKKIKCFQGPEWHFLTKANRKIIIANTYVIDQQSDRMGYRLEGQTIKLKKEEILSSAVMPGTIQLLPNGLPIILMRDCQTTGGYPRILQITEEDINQLAQRRPGDEVQIELKCDMLNLG